MYTPKMDRRSRNQYNYAEIVFLVLVLNPPPLIYTYNFNRRVGGLCHCVSTYSASRFWGDLSSGRELCIHGILRFALVLDYDKIRV